MSAVTNASSDLKVITSMSQSPTGASSGSITAPSISNSIKCNLANGTIADQQDIAYVTTHTFVASTPLVIDLTNVIDIYGATRTFARVNKVVIKFYDTADSHTLLLGYATTTSNAWVSLVTNPGLITVCSSTSNNDGGFVVVAPNTTGYAVSSSNKLFQLDAGSHTPTVDIEIHGRSV